MSGDAYSHFREGGPGGHLQMSKDYVNCCVLYLAVNNITVLTNIVYTQTTVRPPYFAIDDLTF